MGPGTVVIGLASVIIGRAIFGKVRFIQGSTSVIFGSLIYKLGIGVAMQLGLPATDMRLMTAVFFVLVIALQHDGTEENGFPRCSKDRREDDMLELSGIYKTYDPNLPTRNELFTGLDYRVEKGEFISIVGSNGSGKTTLLNIIAGTVACDSGSVNILGEDVTRLSEHKRAKYIARVFQDPKQGTCAYNDGRGKPRNGGQQGQSLRP